MKRPFRFTTLSAAAAASALLGGCAAVVSSTPIGRGPDGAFAGVGIPYLLPKALLPVEVVANGGQIRIDLLEPVYVGDPSLPLALRYAENPFSTDTVKVTVDAATSLLKTVTIDSKDETGEILKKAIATLRAESAAGSGETVVMQAVLDPGDSVSIKAVTAEVDQALRAWAVRQQASCQATPATTGCAEVQTLEKSLTPELTVKLMAPPATGVAAPSAQTAAATAAFAVGRGVDCSVGICYRGTLPYEVSLKALGQTRSTLVQLPNHGPVMALPLTGHAFVNTRHDVALQNGMVQSYEITKPSSALAMVSWPLDVFDAIVATTAKIVQLKIDTSRSSVGLQEQLLAEAKKRKEIGDELEKLKAKPEAAGLIAMGKTGKLLTIATGTPPSLLPPPAAANAANPAPPVGGATVPSLPGSAGTQGK